MRRFAPIPRRTPFVRLFTGIIIAVGIALTTISAQIPGRNVNMVAGNTWPDGDPYLQRQNEPSIGASTRNPLHLLAGSNDYRTVDLPGLTDDEVGDAWLGLYKSYDGGQRWTSTLLPGYPQDQSAAGQASPIHGYGAGADAVVRAGTNGLMYYAGLAFDRSKPATPDVPGKSAIFVARFIDNNNKEAGDTFAYLGARALQTDPGGVGGNFLDKPWMVVDIPRDNARCTIVTDGEKGQITQSVPAGPVYVAYTLRSTDNKGPRYDVMFTRSADCGNTWTTPVKLNDNNERANQGASLAVDPRNGNVYISWRQFDLSANNTGTDALMAAKFTLANKKFDKPGFARKFAKPKKGNGNANGLDPNHFYKKGGVNKALEAAELSPLDQSTSATQIRFRTNAYPTMAVDETGRVYLAFAERGYDPVNPDPVLGAARVLVTTSTDGQTWTAAQAVNVNEPGQKGHQLMPSLTYAGGKLMLIYYDLRETRSKVFSKYVDDKTAFAQDTRVTGLRHTIDLRASMASPGAAPAFAPSVAVSEYLQGPRTQAGVSSPWQVNPPNLPMFQKGTAPFIGDYVDVAAAPNFVTNATGQWIYNSTAGSTPPIFHAVWTDNRDVRLPLEDPDLDGNPWNNYVPPGAPGGVASIFDPSKTVPMCIAGNAGSRNQNVYTARITGGLLVGSPGNTKRLGYRLGVNGQPTNELMQRSFVVFAQNTADLQRRFRFTITNQPLGGRASFDQFSSAPLLVIEADIPYRSTASRTVYASSTDPYAIVNVAVSELVFVNSVWIVKAGGLGSVIVLNPDIDNPDIDNPDIDNPDIDNPDIDNVEVYNPDIDNPDIDNPDIDNPDIDNPDIDNPDIDNVEVANPDIDNPDIDNPDIDNPDIDNPDIDNPDIDNAPVGSLMTDVSWSMTNTGNTTASYNVNLFFAQQTFDPTIKTQLILYRTYKTPVVKNCALKSETRNVLVANVPNPQLVKGSTGTVSNPNDSAATNATIYLAPGESAKITLRVFDPSPDAGSVVTVTNADGSTALISSQFVPNEDVTPVVQQQSVNTVDVDAGVTEPPVVVQFPAPQTVVDTASTSENTPVKLNVLANDSTAFGSTKVISFHPAGMAAHSGGTVGDITYQPSTGFLYTGRGAIDPITSTLVARFPLPPGGFGITSHQANMKNGINYGRTGVPGATLTALDARPDSTTFHTYLPMPAVSASDVIFSFAIDAPHNRIYVLHGPTGAGSLTPTTVSVIAIGAGNPITHQMIGSVPLPLGLRSQTIAVNTRTQKVYVAATGVQGGAQGGVFVIDVNAEVVSALRIPNTTQGAFGVVVNEAANLVFASSSFGLFPNSSFSLYAIDGATNAATSIPTALPFRFSSNDERLAVHEASGKVYMRLQNTVVVIDGKRGSPTRNTVVATINVGQENGNTDIAVDQQKGIVVTVGSLDFQADVIGVASNALLTSIPLSTLAQDVAIDPIRHRAFIGVFTHVLPVQLDPAIVVGLPVPVFIESGGIVLNPLKNKGYAGLFTTKPEIAVLSGSGREGTLSGTGGAGRYVYSAWHDASNRGFFVNQGNAGGTSAAPGTVVVIDGATETIRYTDVPPNPFGIGIDQVNHKVYVASLSAPDTHGQVAILDATAPETPRVLATFTAAVNATGSAFPLNGTGSLLSFGRHVVVNPVTHKVYVMLLGGSATSLAVLDPATNALKPLDGIAGTALHAAQAGANWGRVNVIRVHEGLNRVFVGYLDSNNVGRIVALDGTTDAVVGGPYVAGSHSNRHMASFLVVNEPASLLYVTDYTNGKVTMLGAGDLEFVKDLTLPGGPSATAFNPVSNRLYVSSIDSKTLSAIDGTTLQVLSTVKMPLTAYFMWVDPVESRIYTSGGDSADESGAMVITDVLGQLGTNVSVTTVGSALNGTVVKNADNSVTYTPAPFYSGPDSFNYNIAAPTGTAVGTVKINVVSSSPAAMAFPDSYTTTQGTLLSVPAPGPLANDASPNSPGMSVAQTTTNGTLAPQQNGSFTYAPNPGFTGVDTFTYYAIDDSLGNSNEVTVSITVNPAVSLMVTNTNDSGAGSLRQALITANMDPGSTIAFNIATGTAPFVIQTSSALPAITQPTTINGYSQPGASFNTLDNGTNAQIKVQLNGSSAGNFVNGLTINGGGTTVRGLAIGGFSGSGIQLDVVGGNVIEGNFVGTNTSGTVAMGNGNGGITVQSSGNLIGGNTHGARNLISGNTGQTGVRVQARHQNGVIQSSGSGTVIKGNLIGTTASGLGALSNSQGITVSVSNVTIGGASPTERNVIGGNTSSGISTFAGTFDADQTQTGNGPIPAIFVSAPSSMTVRGNFIGIKADGSGPLGNLSGVFLTGANSVVADNVISGNLGAGVNVSASTDNTAGSPTFGRVWSEATETTVTGNIIGLNPAGTTAIGNTSSGLSIRAADVTVGGASASLRNVISGNNTGGISVSNNFAANAPAAPVKLTGGDRAFIRGNYIGLDAAGTAKIANNNAPGVFSQARNTTIGGPNPGDGNVIVPGTGSGISLQRHTSGTTVINAAGFATIESNVVGLNINSARMEGGGSGSAITIHSASNQILSNIVSGNGVIGGSPPVSGITLFQSFATLNQVKGNIVGTNAAGAGGLGNTARGIAIQDASGNTIGGSNAADRNIVVANGNFGISLDGTSGTTSGNKVWGNYIGVKADGLTAMGNTGVGIHMFANSGATITGNTIGGSAPGERNVIAGNTGDGVNMSGGTTGNTNNNTIAGNYIGIAADGVTARGNGGNGVYLHNAVDNTIGGPNAADGNVIANSFYVGVGMNSLSVRNRILSNTIVASGYLGIDLNNNGLTFNDNGDADSGANNLQNFPVLNGANNNTGNTQVNIDISTFAVGTYTVQVFSSPACDANGYGEGRQLLKTLSVVQPGAGTVTLDQSVLDGQALTATATDSQGNTSEFSACATVTTGGTTVSGTTRYGGNPVPAVTMKLAQGSPTNPPVATALTQSDGTFQFSGVAPGAYHLRADGPDSSYVTWTASLINVGASAVVQNVQLVKRITLLSPAYGSTGVSANPNLTWTANPEAQRYMVQINRTSDWLLIENTQVFTNAYSVATSLSANQNYTWQVHAYDANNRPVGSSENQFNFTIEDTVVVVGPAGSNGGNAFAPVDCPTGSVVIGLAGRAGDDIDQTRIVCAPKPALTPPTTLFVAGGNGGTDYGGALTCAAGEAVSGVFGATRGSSSGWIDYLGVTCTNLVTQGSYNTGTVGSAQAPVFFALSCPAGKQVIGVEGRQGLLLDQISIRCK